MESNFNEFIESIKFGKIEEVKSKFVIDYFKQKDNYGLKPIHWACLTSNIEILEWMLQENCDIETLSENKWRPIHFACYNGDRKIVQVLIENYCKIDCLTNNEETILDVARGDCNHEFIDEILNDNINLKIGLSMGLKCDNYCDHKLCLRSVVQCDFARDEQIGLGRFAIIYKVTNLQNYQKFAVKTVKKYCYDSFANSKCFLRDINKILPDLLNHSKIVNLFGMIETEIELILFMELMDNGSLYDEIRKSGPIGDDYGKIGRYCKDILEAVAFLHSKEILHGFINPTNILIGNNGGCKLSISIFSCSLVGGDIQLNTEKIDAWKSDYLYPCDAPEIVNNERLSYPFDIWFVGRTVIDMLTGNYLRYQCDRIGELNKFISGITNKNLKSFIQSMMHKTPNERTLPKDLLNHKFITDISNDNNNQDITDSTTKNSKLINIIELAIDNNKIGLSMGLKCEESCRHEFCLSSVTATNFKKKKMIGNGSFSKVYKIHVKSGEYWTMKMINYSDDENINKEAKYLENDINLYREFINHENIVKYFGAVRNIKKIFIFMEFIDGESLYRKIKKNKFKPLPLSTIKHYTKQILEGLNFLHNSKIIHRDINSANILINTNNIVKISDFGLSRFLRTISKHEQKSFCGTPNYMSPEIITNELYDCSADIWSLGATVFEMATGHPPYHDNMEMAVIFKIACNKDVEYPTNMSVSIKTFLKLMINGDPKKRSSAESLLNDNFFK